MDRYTNLSWVFRALREKQLEFNWLLTDLECSPYPGRLAEYSDVDPKKNRLWLTGSDLTELVDFNHIQFIWGVLSGFRPGIQPDLVHLDPYPISEGNKALWKPNVQIQHPLAEVEIVCYDSSATLLLTSTIDLALGFRAFFPEAIDLDNYNRARQSAA